MTMTFKIAASAISALLYAFSRNHKAVNIAKRYIGQSEVYDNQGFNDPNFLKEMVSVDWKKGQAWCMYFVRLVYTKAFPQLASLHSLINPNSQVTWQNFSNDKTGKFKILYNPQPGDIVIYQFYQNGKATATGHSGIVTSVSKDSFTTIEGNTSLAGSNQGKFVAEKKRQYIYATKDGLAVKGFIRIVA
jgi:hypothetical protein